MEMGRGRTYPMKAGRATGRRTWGGRYADQSRAAVAQRRNMRQGGFMGIKLKFFDSSRVALALTAPTDAAGGEADPTTLNCLFAPVQGTGAQNRDGRRVTMKSVQIEGIVELSNVDGSATAVITPRVFIALVLDKQTNAAQLNSEDVYTNPAANADMATSPLRDLERSTRFTVLKTWDLNMSTTGMGTAAANDLMGKQLKFSCYKKLDHRVEFVLNGGTVADIQDNSLHLIAYASNGNGAPNIGYNCRVRFQG